MAQYPTLYGNDDKPDTSMSEQEQPEEKESSKEVQNSQEAHQT